MLSCISYWYIFIICKYFLPFSRLSFYFVDGFLCCAKAFHVNLMKEMCVIYWTISYQEIFKFLFPVSNKGTRSTFKQSLFGLVYFQGTEFQMWICCAMDDFKSSRFDTTEELVSDLEKRSEETTQNAVYREKRMKIWKSTSDAHISAQRQKEKKGEKRVFFISCLALPCSL